MRTPEQGRDWVRWIAERGYDGIKFFNNEDPATMAAILDESDKLGLGSVAHLGQRGVAQVNAKKATELGHGRLQNTELGAGHGHGPALHVQ